MQHKMFSSKKDSKQNCLKALKITAQQRSFDSHFFIQKEEMKTHVKL